MSARVYVIDYGMGNLLSVMRALESLGASPVLVESSLQLRDAGTVLLPGVGAFSDGMRELTDRGFVEPIRRHVEAGRPFLGICLGMQMMLSRGHEFTPTAGIGLIAGDVALIPDTTSDGKPHKRPHVGWSPLASVEKGATWGGSPLAGLNAEAQVYFVHSYGALPDHRENVLAVTQYNGREIVAAVRSGSAVGVQFHPEKSGPVGLAVLSEFLKLSQR